jgi:hypothetical protein
MRPDDNTLTSLLLSQRVVDDRGCWLWQGGVSGSGYGRFTRRSFRRDVHRLMWELTHGPIPEGLCVLHRCDVRLCMNPDHLFLGTKGDNARDCAAKGRTVNRTGENHHRRALTAAQVATIRARYTGARGQQAALAREYGVKRSTIGAIIRRVSWSHLP